MLVQNNHKVSFHVRFQSKIVNSQVLNKLKTQCDEITLSKSIKNINDTFLSQNNCKGLVDQINKIRYTESEKKYLKKVQESLDDYMIESKVLKKLDEICFSDIKEPIYNNLKKNIDQDNIAIEITEYFDKNGILRKIEQKDKFSDMLLSAEIFNEKGYPTYKVLTINQPDGNVLVSKTLFDGTKDTNLLDTQRVLLDINNI